MRLQNLDYYGVIHTVCTTQCIMGSRGSRRPLIRHGCLRTEKKARVRNKKCQQRIFDIFIPAAGTLLRRCPRQNFFVNFIFFITKIGFSGSSWFDRPFTGSIGWMYWFLLPSQLRSINAKCRLSEPQPIIAEDFH